VIDGMTVTSLSVSLQHKTRVAPDHVCQITLNCNCAKRNLLVYLRINYTHMMLVSHFAKIHKHYGSQFVRL